MDTTEQIKDLQNQINELKNMILALNNPASVPPEVLKALQLKLGVMVSSGKTASSENQAVNESGSSSYSVLKPPDGFDQRVDGTTVKYFPYYT